MQSTYRFIIWPVIFLLLSGCASLPDDKNLKQHAQSFAQSSKLAGSSLLQRAKLKMQKGKSASLQLYAPSYFAQAKIAYAQAQQAYKEKAKEQQIKTQAQLSIEYIDSGMRNKKVVLDTLKKSLKNRLVLLELKSKKHFPAAFNSIQNQLLELVKLIEQRQLDAALAGERDVLKKMRALEVKTIDFIHLAKAENMLQQARQQEVQKLLPNTYTKTLNTLNDTRQYIRQNPRKKLRIDELSRSSLFASQRLFFLARQAKRIQLLENPQIERSVLLHEEQLQRINQAAKQQDVRNLSFNDQSLVLAEQINKIIDRAGRTEKSSDKTTQAELDKWKRKVVLLQSEIRRLHRLINED